MLAALVVALAVQAPPPPPVAFVDVAVLPMDTSRVLEHQTVVVRDGRIALMGPVNSVRIPDGAVRVEGAGKFLMPGLTEMHGHLPNPAAPNMQAGLVEAVLYLYLANGVTSIRGMQGQPPHLALRDRIARGEVLGPRLWVPGPPLSGNGAPTPADGRRLVEEQKAGGFDHIKIHEGLSIPTYDTIAAAAKRAGLDFAGHVPNAVGVTRALAAGQKSIDHLDNYVDESGDDAARMAELARATARAGTWTVPTLALWEVFMGTEPVELLAARPELRYVPPQWANNWRQQVTNMRQNNPADGGRTVELRRRMLKALRDAGAPIALGTDSPQLFSVPGFSIHREMRAMQEAGLSAWDILSSGTRNVARYYGREREFGTVARGQRADLLLLEGNPLEDIGNVERRAGVMVNGRWIPERDIQARLAQIAQMFGGGTQPGGNDDEAGIRRAIGYYFAGHATGVADTMARAFHPSAELKFIRNGAFTARPLADYLAGFTGRAAPDEARRVRRIVSIDIAGTAASAKLELDYPTTLITDYMQLLKIDGEWKIVHKVYHTQPKAGSEEE
jgi:imidazolonepropionase-like amidohydrolase